MSSTNIWAEIVLTNPRSRYTVGDHLTGTALITFPQGYPQSTLLAAAGTILVSYNCVGEVKWEELVGPHRHRTIHTYHDQHEYHHDEVAVAPAQVTKVDDAKVRVPFSFIIPEGLHLPSTMLSSHGMVQHFIRVAVRDAKDDDVWHKFVKELVVESPIEHNLMITVGGSAEKTVLLHGNAPVAMHASIGRKGFAPGEQIAVHVAVDNKTSVKVTPRIHLYQVQIYMCHLRHKTTETLMNPEPIVGAEVPPNGVSEEVLSVAIPREESLSIKSPLITVKYFVQVTLDIPQSFDLHISLPVVVTAQRVLDKLHETGADRPVATP